MIPKGQNRLLVVAGFAEMMAGGTFVDGAVHDEVACGHRGYGCHLVAHKQDGRTLGKGAYYPVEVRLEMLVDVA